MKKVTNTKQSYLKRLGDELFYNGITYASIKKNRNKDTDYLHTQQIEGTELSAGLGEIQGLRDEQEDHLSVHSAHSFNLLDSKQQKDLLQKCFDKMILQYGSTPDCGSTACIAIAFQEKNTLHLISANMGDSSAFVVILESNPSGQYHPVLVERINKVLHNMEEDPEWLEMNAGRVRRVNDTLALTRSIGDADTKEADLLYNKHYSHQNDPDIDIDEIPLKSNQIALLLQMCDGGTEKDYDGEPCLNETKIGEIIATYYTQRDDYPDFLSEIIFQLIKTAFNHQNNTQNGSQDNISMALIPIENHQPPVMSLLFDGHGGDAVSKGLGRDFSGFKAFESRKK